MHNLNEHEQKPIFADINVTPLVDVMLVLLIIFMITAPFMTSTVGVDLPEGKGTSLENTNSILTITIDKNEHYLIADKAYTLNEIGKYLKESPRVANKEPIFIEADESIRHKALMSLMSKAHSVGATKINIMMQEP